MWQNASIPIICYLCQLVDLSTFSKLLSFFSGNKQKKYMHLITEGVLIIRCILVQNSLNNKILVTLGWNIKKSPMLKENGNIIFV